MAIVIGDIHGDVDKARSFLAYKRKALHVALGDYLDSYHEPIERQLECLQLLMDSKAVLLLGNHECHYLKKPLFQFAGYQLDHADMLQDIMETNLDRFLAAYEIDGYLLTHAGANRKITGKGGHDEKSLASLYNSRWISFNRDRSKDVECPYPYESIFWFNYFVEAELTPLHINQIFGHVENPRPVVELNYIALDTTNFSNSCWLYDTECCELVQL